MTREEYEILVKEMARYAYEYYTLASPSIDDSEYDTKYQLLKEYEAEYPEHISSESPTQYIGDNTTKTGLIKVKHKNKMYSMEDVFTDEEVDNWIRKLPGSTSLICEYKLDGVSLEVIYKDGILIDAVSRGDGIVGESVKDIVPYIKHIPSKIDIDGLFIIRGEVVIHSDDLERVNAYRRAHGMESIKNTRNGAAGAIRSLDKAYVKNACLQFYFWEINESSKNTSTYLEDVSLGKSLGFTQYGTPKEVEAHGEILYIYHDVTSHRSDLDIVIDGLVIKVNDKRVADSLGFTAKFPRWMIAFKFKAEKHLSKILSVTHQIGRTGVLTPVAEIKPIDIGGVTVSRVTLHNYYDVTKKDIRINDVVEVIRSGDVIPKIVGIVKDRRTNECTPIIPPNECPGCGSEITMIAKTYQCINLECPSVLIKGLVKLASRSCLNIDGLGEKVAEELVNKKIVKSPIDIFKLTKDDLVKLDNFKEKRIVNLLNAIENTKGIALDKWIASLAIPYIGSTLSPVIAEHFGTDFIEYTLEKDYDTITAIDGIGHETAVGILNYIDDNRGYIKESLEIIQPTQVEKIETVDSVLSGKRVLITGKFEKTRDEMKDLLKRLGATPVSSVSKNTDLVIWGGDKSSKVGKAESLGIEIWDENDFKNNIEE